MPHHRGLIVVAGFVPTDDDLAHDALKDIVASGGERYPAIASFCEDLATRFPEAVVDNEHLHNDGSTTDRVFRVGTRHVGVVIVSGDVVDIALGVIQTALQNGLAVFDVDTNQIHRPGGFQGFTLTVEDRPLVVGPRWCDVLSAVADLTPAGGPSFMVVGRAGNDYAQIAGGDGQFTFERREPTSDGFRHYVAGYPGDKVRGIISVMTNGFHVPVRSNENLSVSDVTRLFESYLDDDGLSPDFCWRDMTHDFK